MYHPRFKGTHYEMGQKMGTIFKKANVRFPIKLDAFQTEFGINSGALLEQLFPEIDEEIKGITDTTGYDHEIFRAWMMCMGCCMYNLDEESCMEIRGCTAFSFSHNSQIIYGRDNDLPPYMKQASKSIYYQPANKMNFILNTSSFINGEEGINEAGLVTAMTFVLPKMEEIKPGINSVFLVRCILENCKTVDEGIALLRRLPIGSSCNILLTDRTGKMIVMECNPEENHIRHAETNNDGEEFIITVNHFSSEKMRDHDASNRNIYHSGERYQTALKALTGTDYKNSIEHAKNILSGKHGFMCQYDKSLNFDTIWSSVFNISNEKIYRAEGNPRRAGFSEDKRLIFSNHQ